MSALLGRVPFTSPCTHTATLVYLFVAERSRVSADFPWEGRAHILMDSSGCFSVDAPNKCSSRPSRGPRQTCRNNDAEVEQDMERSNAVTQLNAASSLLQLTCDAVVELDGSPAQIVKTPSPQGSPRAFIKSEPAVAGQLRVLQHRCSSLYRLPESRGNLRLTKHSRELAAMLLRDSSALSLEARLSVLRFTAC